MAIKISLIMSVQEVFETDLPWFRRYKLKSTGGGSEDKQTEYDLRLEELTHLSEESDKKANTEVESPKEKLNAEKEVAFDIWKRAMETMGQT